MNRQEKKKLFALQYASKELYSAKLKDKIQKQLKFSVIYSIQWQCCKEYIGQTERNLRQGYMSISETVKIKYYDTK